MFNQPVKFNGEAADLDGGDDFPFGVEVGVIGIIFAFASVEAISADEEGFATTYILRPAEGLGYYGEGPPSAFPTGKWSWLRDEEFINHSNDEEFINHSYIFIASNLFWGQEGEPFEGVEVLDSWFIENEWGLDPDVPLILWDDDIINDQAKPEILEMWINGFEIGPTALWKQHNMPLNGSEEPLKEIMIFWTEDIAADDREGDYQGITINGEHYSYQGKLSDAELLTGWYLDLEWKGLMLIFGVADFAGTDTIIIPAGTVVDSVGNLNDELDGPISDWFW